jgi:hypothetical protein
LVTGLGGQVGMVQASCNPFKKERALKGIDLGEIKNEVLDFFKPELENEILTYRLINKIAEKKATDESVGFTMRDFEAIYGDLPSFKNNSVNAYDFLKANSGGHKCITNISGINYVYSGYDKPYTKDLPEELLPIANYTGDNNFVNNIKTQLLKYRKLSEKQREAAMRQIGKENKFDLDDVQTSSSRTSRDLVIDMRNKFIDILQRKIDKN